jgi:hypothetical protein
VITASVWRWRIGFSLVLVVAAAGLAYLSVAGVQQAHRRIHGTFTNLGCREDGTRGRGGRTYYCLGGFVSDDGAVDIPVVSLRENSPQPREGQQIRAGVDSPDAQQAVPAGEDRARLILTTTFAAVLLGTLALMWWALLRSDRRHGAGPLP